MNKLNMKITLSLMVAALAFATKAATSNLNLPSTSFVDPFIGTTAKCHCTPAAARPFGMVMPGPDTRINSWDATSGYDYADASLLGFSQTHISGTGCPDLGDLLLHPISGMLVEGEYRSFFRHADERAEPGYYSVDLPGFQVKSEITCTERVAFYRFTYRSNDAHHLLVDTQHGIAFPGNFQKHVVASSVAFPDERTMTGSARLKNWVERELHWVMKFDRPVVSRTESPHPWGGKGKRHFLTFDIPSGGVLQVKVALSMTGVEGAQRNLDAELPHWDFARVRREACAVWNELLGRIAIDGVDTRQKRIFYTALYHALLHPDDIADVDGRYRGADGKVAVSPNGHYYSTLSLWDSFRAQQPLLAEFVPERVDGIVETLLLHWKAAGFLPVWALAGRDNQCMVGSHAVPVIVDAYLRGYCGFDAELAYAAVRDTLRNAHPARQKERWDLLDRYGYYPYDEIRGESVSRTLECAYDDACAARFAEALGKAEDATFFSRRAANWTNVIDRAAGFARGRDTAGRWREPFDPLTCGQGAEHPNDFTEGNSWQYTWHVMHDVQGLVAWLGGKDAFVKRLDRLFVEPPAMKGYGTMEYLENAIGQYAHGNEQVHHVPWLYSCAGRKDKASQWTKRICEECYSDTPAGYRGNEDCGQLSAWYVFAVLGRYPVDPCGGTYAESEPLAPVIRTKVRGVPDILPPRGEHAAKSRAYSAGPSIAVAPNGRLWATWHAGRTGGEDKNGYIVLATSEDDGATWTEVAVADPDGDGPRAMSDPQVWVDPDRRLRWTFSERLRIGKGTADCADAQCKTCLLGMATLPDANVVPEELPQARKICRGVMMGKPTVLRDGAWLMPVYRGWQANSSGAVVSTDRGTTWRWRGGADIPAPERCFDEHSIVEAKNGDLHCYSRTNNDMFHALSHDQGRTWTTDERPRICQPSARFLVRRLSTGRWLMVKHGELDRRIGRSRLKAFVSEDEGRTWKGGLLLDERDNVSYPDCDQRADGLIYVIYDFERTGAQEIAFATLTEDDVRAGRNVSGKVRLRRCISRKPTSQTGK